MRRIAIALATVGSLSCSNSNEPTRMACEINNTAKLTFTNLSPHPQNIIWDGVQIFTRLAPSAISQPPTEATAGVAHTLVVRHSDTNAVNCSAQPILIRCQISELTCPN